MLGSEGWAGDLGAGFYNRPEDNSTALISPL